MPPPAVQQDRRPAFVPALEGLRGFAALLVVVYHCWLLTHVAHIDDGIFRALLSTGFFGLNFFFVLSGFVLFLPTVINGRFGSVRKYAVRRAARILPAYYASILIAIVALPLIAASLDAARESVNAGSLIAHLTFTQTEARLIPGYDSALGFTVNPVLWTLSVEAAFYVALPLVARHYAAKPLLALAGAVAIAVACRYAVVHGWLGLGRADSAQALSLFPMFLTDFAVGMTGAALYVRWRDREGARRWAPVGATVALITLVGSMLLAGSVSVDLVRAHTRESVLLSSAVPLAFGALALAATLCPTRLQWPVTNRAARFAGKVSYGTYLFHFMAIGLALYTFGFSRDGSNMSFYAMVAFVVPVSLLLGWLSFVGIEQPARRWARRRLERRRDRAHSPALRPGSEVSPRRSPA